MNIFKANNLGLMAESRLKKIDSAPGRFSNRFFEPFIEGLRKNSVATIIATLSILLIFFISFISISSDIFITKLYNIYYFLSKNILIGFSFVGLLAYFRWRARAMRPSREARFGRLLGKVPKFVHQFMKRPKKSAGRSKPLRSLVSLKALIIMGLAFAFWPNIARGADINIIYSDISALSRLDFTSNQIITDKITLHFEPLRDVDLGFDFSSPWIWADYANSIIANYASGNIAAYTGGLIKVNDGVYLTFDQGSSLIMDDTLFADGVCSGSSISPDKGVCKWSKPDPIDMDPSFRNIFIDARNATLEFLEGSELIFHNGQLVLNPISGVWEPDPLEETNYSLMSAHFGALILNDGSKMMADIGSFVNQEKFVFTTPGYFFNGADSAIGFYPGGGSDGGGIMIENLIVKSGAEVDIRNVSGNIHQFEEGYRLYDQYHISGSADPISNPIVKRRIANNLIFDLTDKDKTIAMKGRYFSGSETTSFIAYDWINYLENKDKALIEVNFQSEAKWSIFSELFDSLENTFNNHPEVSVFTVLDSAGLPGQLDLNFKPFDYFTLVDCVSCDAPTPNSQYLNLKFAMELNDFEDMDYLLTSLNDEDLDKDGIPNPSIIGSKKIRYLYLSRHYVSPAREKVYLQSRLASGVFLLQGGDLLARSLRAQARQWKKQDGFSTLFATQGFNMSLQSGSSIDFKGFSFLLGPAWRASTAWGRLTLGGVLEGGRGDYVTRDQYSDIGEVKGEGDVDYLGLGLYATHDFSAGFHAELAARGGRLRNSYDASHEATGRRDRLRDAKFETTSSYFGGYLSFGYLFEPRPNWSMDVYGQGLWTRLGSAEAFGAVSKSPIHFYSNNMVNLRAGVRCSYTGLENLNFYVGAAYDRALSGNYVDGELYRRRVSRLDQPSAKGDTGIYEVGLTWRPIADSGFVIDLSGQGYSGQTDGLSGTIILKWEFGSAGNPTQSPTGT